MKPNSRVFWIYLTVLGLACSGVVWYITALHGPGVGTDGAIQVSTADHLLHGRGFVDYAGNPYLRWPPLYPLVLAGLSLISGIDSFSIGWFLNWALFGINIWLGGILLYTCFSNEPVWAIVGTLIMASSVSLVALSATLGTDPLFITLVLGWILAAGRYLTRPSRANLLGMAVLACMAALQRLPGVTLIAAGAVLILYSHQKRFLQGAGIALPFTVLTSLPLVLWVVVHNNLQNDTLFGIPLFLRTRPLVNFRDSLGKIWHWFVPYSISHYLPGLVVLPLLGLFLLVLYRRGDWKRVSQKVVQPYLFPSLVFFLFYYLFLIFTINSVDTKYPYYDRYYIVMLAPMLALIFVVMQDLLHTRFSRFQTPVSLILLTMFAIWLIYPLNNLNKYIRLGRTDGLPGYNLYNTRTLRQSKIINVLQEISAKDNSPIYSNYPAAVWYYTRRDAPEIPTRFDHRA